MHGVIVGVAGIASGNAQAGKSVPVPTGAKRAEVTVSGKTVYTGQVLGALAASSACTDVTIEVFSADSGQGIGRDSNYQCVFAPVAWFAEMSGSESKDFVFSGPIPSGATNIIVIGDAHSLTVGGGTPGYADGLARVEITKIRVRFVMN